MASSRSTLDLPALESWLREAACVIRGPIDAPKFKDDILPLIFLKKQSFLSVADKTTNLACINVTTLTAPPVPRPPRRDHQVVGSYLSDVDATFLAEEARRIVLDRLFQSLLHDLMTGTVRVDHLAGQIEPEATA